MQKEFDFNNDQENPQRFKRLTDFFSDPKPSEPQKAGAAQPAQTEGLKKSPQSVGQGRPARSEQSKPMTVCQLNDMIQAVIATQTPARVWVEGEVSNCKRHGSGHIYMSLKDSQAAIAAVIWRSTASKLRFELTDGLAVLVKGRIDYYSGQGKLQLIVDKVEPAGLGALELEFRQLFEKLKKEGLFDQRHKMKLPRFPSRIAVVTSGTGAAIRDIEQTLNRRFPAVEKLLYPVKVQGEGAAEEIAAAIEAINRRKKELGGVDLMIVGRGGGSIEDLWAFNEEIVARAIFASEIPIVSAVGHEVDTTIADYVADVRAATPTAGAELAVPDRTELERRLSHQADQMTAVIGQRLATQRDRLVGIGQRELFARPLERIYRYAQGVDERAARLGGATGQRINQARRELDKAAQVLRQIEPFHRVSQLKQELLRRQMRLAGTVSQCIKVYSERVSQKERGWLRLDPRMRVKQYGQDLEQQRNRLTRGVSYVLELKNNQLTGITQRLKSLDPKAVLRRGYSITRLAGSGQVVGDIGVLKAGGRIVTELKDRQLIESEIKAVRREDEH